MSLHNYFDQEAIDSLLSWESFACRAPSRPNRRRRRCRDRLPRGKPTSIAMVAVVTDRDDPGKSLIWIDIGSVAGPTASIPSAALRAPPTSRSPAASKALSAPEKSSRNCLHSRWRSPAERSISMHGPRHSPMSNKPGPSPPTPTSALSSPHNPEHAQRTPTPFRTLPPCGTRAE